MTRPQDLVDRVAVVTGAAHGIGAAVTAELAARGARIVAVDVSGYVSRLAEPGLLTPLRADVTDPGTPALVLAAAADLGGPASILVQAAYEGTPAPLGQPDESWHRTFDLVLSAARRLGTAFVAARDPSGPATIVHLASPHAHGAVPGFAAYAAAKAGLLALTRAAAVEWGPLGVRCNAVAPGFVPVERNRDVWSDPELGDALRSASPLGRFATVGEVARAVAFLASEESSFVNGACLAVDGGMAAMLPEALLR
ncbi:SDR family oxidoreductase [Kitasatospora terrestris]|uniref:SDR family NAD(P)-dependent oxidoreductase n=1 Tax=Kitasatospora terrestris TaxID=258051 RepID=A0ABP9ER87_9ACTN